MAKRPSLKVEKREITGKKVKQLRREGIVPANIYGKDFVSTAVQLPLKSFNDTFKEVGETGLVDLELDDNTMPVLIKNVYIDPRSASVLHADFHKVNLKEKITAQIPIFPVGEAPAVVDNLGILLHPLSELEVEALPTELPEKIEVNIENLKEVDQQITVADLKVEGDVTVLTDPGTVVFKIDEIKEPEPEPEPIPAEGEEAAEGEVTAEEGKEKAEGSKPEAEAKPKEEEKKD